MKTKKDLEKQKYDFYDFTFENLISYLLDKIYKLFVNNLIIGQ